MATVDHVLYLHGFNSHPSAWKSEMTRKACALATPRPDFHAPHLIPRPGEAFAIAEAAFRALPGRTLVIGSSLGGFVGLGLAERFDVEALVLINPAVRPSMLASQWVGTTHENPYTGDACFIEPAFVDELKALEVTSPRRMERCLAIYGTADDTLDYREAEQLLKGSRTLLSEGDTHGLDRYADFLPTVLAQGGLTLNRADLVECLS
ncbi:YqiA/YcfP family alpha/beta fold hydrolase [Larsenimonas rhizosphaerae]|uniref:Alpha/beta fold hydrolase n=1 Tax=Larsenimonas rhizosphaerae TaxID=2944682 RepID=A0AA41ZH79_9GAMM|nr:YqiA/YcfP family alpha/beta fold hydrolase [Larsenimonas rhizosphaerae]MCM2132109.1 alpha/beta fold hydrolase [Larsenimonas rhizosphaerae]MCX2524712.1 alpha/beta fold hydrolase [Larsenimonas rhizosphaerae]